MLATAWNAYARYRGRSRFRDLGATELASTENTAFARELERQTLISEQRRAALLGWSLTALLVVRVIYQGSYGFRGDVLPGRSYTLLILACWILLQWLTSLFLGYRLRKGKERLAFRAYISAALEVAMPTIAMLIMCSYDSPRNVLTSSIPYTYFLVLILSPLRLDMRLCIFTGVFAALNYGVLVGVYEKDLAREWIGPSEMMHLSFFLRSLLLIVGGLAAGFVSQRIRVTLTETLREVQERERVLAVFGQHVSPAVVNQLLSQASSEESEQREVCVMVLDIRNFTTFSEARSPDEVVLYLNTLWSFMVATVNDHHGIVNKFLGDGFLAVFGAPLATDNNSANAIAASRRILREVDELVASGDLPPTEIGLALHTGPAIIGNVGSAERKEYTVIGDVVNVAFRIEALNKGLGSRLLISESVHTAAESDEGEPIPGMCIRGRRDCIDLFRLA
jgi:adenylate cyclase